MNTLPISNTVKSQTLKFEKLNVRDKDYGTIDIIVDVRFDDRCGNGHNTFAITGSIYKAGRRSDNSTIVCGCIHDDIYKHFPELRGLIKWHLVSSDGPMHYIANTLYHAKNGALSYAQSSAVWSDATLEQLNNKDLLVARLPSLMAEFKIAVESLCMEY
jgi:hypothetical protein